MKRIYSLLVLLALLLCACQAQTSTKETSSASAKTANPSELFEQTDVRESDAAEIKLLGDSAASEDIGVSIRDNTVRILRGGSYRLSGTLKGMVIVEAGKADAVNLILDGADIESESSAALYIKQADKVTVSLSGENLLVNGGAFTQIDENNIDGAVFSEDDLTFCGKGSVQIVSPAGHGVVGKDDLVFTEGSFVIEAEKHGCKANDSICIANGTFTITSGKDAFHAENDKDAALGFVYVENGSITAETLGDGLSAGAYLQIDGGTFRLTTGGGSANGAMHTEQFGGPFGGQQSTQEDDSVSSKGLKALGDIYLNGGSFTIDSADDAIHCNADLLLCGGEFAIQSGDDAFHADAKLQIDNGTINIAKSYEGLEAQCIEINGGYIDLFASDDAMNAAGGNDESGFGGNDMFANDTSAYIRINGGVLTLNAGGDGIDSNGSIYVTGGETYLSGPTNNGNGSLDYGGEATISGGIFVAAGSSGMAAGFGTNSTQGAIFVSYSTQPAGSRVSLTDASGIVIFSWETVKESSSVVLSCPEILQGETYHLVVGAIEGDITMTDIIYGYSGGGPGGAPGGGPGGRPGGRP